MQIVKENLPWSNTDTEQLRFFLETPTGQRLVPKLVESAPSLLPAGDTNSILIRSGEVRGIQIVVSALLALAHPTPDESRQPESYPPLDDDSAWKLHEAARASK